MLTCGCTVTTPCDEHRPEYGSRIDIGKDAEVAALRARIAKLEAALRDMRLILCFAKPLIARGDDPLLVPFMDVHRPIEAIDAALKGD